MMTDSPDNRLARDFAACTNSQIRDVRERAWASQDYTRAFILERVYRKRCEQVAWGLNLIRAQRGEALQ